MREVYIRNVAKVLVFFPLIVIVVVFRIEHIALYSIRLLVVYCINGVEQMLIQDAMRIG